MLTNIEKTARRRAWTFAGCAAALAAFALSVAAPAALADPPRHAKAHGYYKNKDKKGDRGQYRYNDYRDDRYRDRDRDNDGIRNRYDGDRDGDGIRDRYDRYPNDRYNGRRDRDRDNDGVRNRRDRDRDGDGVRNRRDRFPSSLRRP